MTDTQKFETPAPITAILNVNAGRVHLTATDRPETTVRVGPANPGRSRDTRAAAETTVSFADGELRVRTPGAKVQIFGPSGAVDVTIELPADSRVNAMSGATELRTTGRLGEVTFDGAYRHITLDEATNLHLTAVDGDIEIGRLHGPAQISTARGDIRVTEATHGDVVLRTQFGGITIGAAPGVSATMDAGTNYGRISNSLKNDGNPQLQIRATTPHGNITAHSL